MSSVLEVKLLLLGIIVKHLYANRGPARDEWCSDSNHAQAARCFQFERTFIQVVNLHLQNTMAHPISRFLSSRLCQPSSLFLKQQSFIPRTFHPQFPKSAARRSYATGESGPNPKPGQNPFKVWPFVAITLAGSGAYALMVKSRAGTFPLLHLRPEGMSLKLSRAQFESRFKNQHSQVKRPLDVLSSFIFYPACKAEGTFTDNHLRNQTCLQPPSRLPLPRKTSQLSPPLK
jgi:hypothetical protein